MLAHAVAHHDNYSPLVGAFHSDGGAMNLWTHFWAYESFEQRLRIREETRAKSIWPPRISAVPFHQESKILMPAVFSPLQ